MLIIVPRTIENRWAIEYDLMFFIGAGVGIFGLLFLASTITLFIRIGRGTLAPWSPTQRLVIRGPYAHVRNPMITSVLSILLAESLVVHSMPIFFWFIAFFIINNIYFTLSEEPGLERRFGDEYIVYKQNVPRWIPRLTPWAPDSN